MLFIVMGVLDLSLGYRTQIRLENAAREGAAFGQLYPNMVSGCAGDDITDRVLAEEPGLSSMPDFQIRVLSEDVNGDLVVPVTGCGATTVEGRLLVEVTGTFDVTTPMVERATGDITLTGGAQVEVQG